MSATPILDLEQDPPTARANKWLAAACLAFGAAIGLPIDFGSNVPGFNLLLWIPCVYVAVAIHELGTSPRAKYRAWLRADWWWEVSC